MGRQIRAAKVYQTAQGYLESSVISGRPNVPPPWLKALEFCPPSETLTRPYPLQHTPPNPRVRKPRHIFRPTRIVYAEDELRRDFFRDHPWELARPMVVLELDGKDARGRDWSKGLVQPGMPLSGECVVQRQLWLMENTPGLSKQQAYDQVRKDFYKLRLHEDMQRRIAVEEARMVGAYFGKSRLRVGMELEDQHFEAWKTWAAEEIAKIDAERAQASALPFEAEEDESAVAVAPASVPGPEAPA